MRFSREARAQKGVRQHGWMDGWMDGCIDRTIYITNSALGRYFCKQNVKNPSYHL
jgi:hypothetical protein